jgi:uncharacterized repeat protein (TIGR01451 family)
MDPLGLIYAIAVRNLGPGAATGVTMTDPLPSSLTLVSATASQGSCSGASTVTCNLGGLASSAAATITLVVRASAAATVSNTASVGGNESDPDPANNSSTFTASIGAGAAIPLLSPLAQALLVALLAAAALLVLARAR